MGQRGVRLYVDCLTHGPNEQPAVRGPRRRIFRIGSPNCELRGGVFRRDRGVCSGYPCVVHRPPSNCGSATLTGQLATPAAPGHACGMTDQLVPSLRPILDPSRARARDAGTKPGPVPELELPDDLDELRMVWHSRRHDQLLAEFGDFETLASWVRHRRQSQNCRTVRLA